MISPAHTGDIQVSGTKSAGGIPLWKEKNQEYVTLSAQPGPYPRDVMCERYVIPEQIEVEREFSLTRPWWKFRASFNVSHGRNVPVIRVHERESEGVMMRWGLIPDWAQGDASKGSAPHAPVHELDRSKLFRDAWRGGQRCILPMAGFYGWQLTRERYRQPFFIRLVNRAVFGLAALWTQSLNEEEDDVIESCALITVPPNPLMAEIHNVALHMPAILQREEYEAWLTSPAAEAASLLHTYPQERMVTHPVSPRINSLKYDDEWLARPLQHRFGPPQALADSSRGLAARPA